MQIKVYVGFRMNLNDFLMFSELRILKHLWIHVFFIFAREAEFHFLVFMVEHELFDNFF